MDDNIRLKIEVDENIEVVGLVVYLAGCVINQITPILTESDSMILDKVYQCASRHMMSAIVAKGIEKAGLADQRSSRELGRALHRAILFENAWKEIAGELEIAGIHYLPLKGVVLKQYYPSFELREMSDHDILIDPSRAEDVKNIMEELGYSTEKYGISGHDVYYKKPVLNFEMHRELFSQLSGNAIFEYYRDVNRFLQGKEYHHSLSAEDFYVYMIAHEFKHFSGSGTGLRSLLDTYVFLKQVSLDIEYVEREIAKLGLSEFEQQNRSLALKLFSGETVSETENQMLEYIASSGIYGTMSNRINNRIKAYGGRKERYILHRLIAPISPRNKDYDAYAREYPLFYKHKILLLFLPFYRIYRALGSGRLSAEAKILKRYSNNSSQGKTK